MVLRSKKALGRKESGYSLTEILVVLFLMSLLTTITMPLLSSVLPGILVDSHVRQVRAELGDMRREAMHEAQILVMEFDGDNRTVRLRTDTEILREWDWPRRLTIAAYPAPEDENSFDILVSPDGRFNGPDVLLTSRGRSQLLKIDPVSGRLLIGDMKGGAS